MAIDAINSSNMEELEDYAIGNGYPTGNGYPYAIGNGHPYVIENGSPVAPDIGNGSFPNSLIHEVPSNILSHGIEAAERVSAPLTDRVTSFPNLAWEVMQAAAKKEEFDSAEINRHSGAARKLNQKIEKLIQLNKHAQGKEGDNFNQKDPAVQDLLKELEIELPENTTVGRARNHFDNLTSQHRADLNHLITTQIQVKLQHMQSMNDIVRDINRKEERLYQAINAITQR